MQSRRDGSEAHLPAIAVAAHESRVLEQGELLHDGLPRDGQVPREGGRRRRSALGQCRQKRSPPRVGYGSEGIGQIGHVQPNGCT